MINNTEQYTNLTQPGRTHTSHLFILPIKEIKSSVPAQLMQTRETLIHWSATAQETPVLEEEAKVRTLSSAADLFIKHVKVGISNI